ncbi:MAG: alpha/beta hydrolase [Myxococcales bacterium]|nr:alpha/beta hydrolase [Myxococcales bacterium]
MIRRAIRSLERQLLYPSHLIAAPPGPPPGLDGEVLHRDLGGEAVEAWFLPARAGEGARPLVVFAHGNGELIDLWVEPLGFYRRWGCHLLLVEYRGYGRSGGEPCEAALAGDVAHFIDRLRGRPEVSEQLILHGRSLGGGVVCAAARLRAPTALVLMSTFRSVTAMARRLRLPGFLVTDTYDNEGFLRGYRGPLLIYHGTADSLIPFAHAEALASAAPQARLVADEGVDHNELPRDQAGFVGGLRALLEGAGVTVVEG